MRSNLLKMMMMMVMMMMMGEVMSQCGPPQCYNGCTDARPKVDFVFLIDGSGSMQNVINGVKSGLTTFAESLDGNKIDPRFSLVVFGKSYYDEKATLLADLTTLGPFKTKMDALTASGGHEAGLESMRMMMDKANVGNLGISYRTGQNVKRVYILATDEDSDPAYYSANIWGSQSTTTSGVCYPDGDMSQSSWNNNYQAEIDYVANNLIAAETSLYMFVKKDSKTKNSGCNTNYQYCNPGAQVQDADYKNFNKATTLSNMASQSPSERYSLQGRLLDAGLSSRCFDVAEATDSNLIKNFFAEIVADVSKCEYCYDYPCSGSSCLAPVNMCDCEGVKYGTKTKDPNGVCCEDADKDCAGYCSGPHTYDQCGVCTNGGALFSACVKDCNNNYYLNLPANPTSLPTYSGLIYKTTCPNVAGYLLKNTDLIKANFVTSEAACNHFHTYGRFEGRSYCTFDAARYVQENPGVTLANAEADWLSRLAASSTLRSTSDTNPIAFCTAGSNLKFPPLAKDACNQCIISPDSPPYCVADCSGTLRTNPADAYKIDDCNTCVAPSAPDNGNRDECNVCFGKNALKNECGVCANGPEGKDGCNQNVCENLPCTKDCDGVERPTSTMKLDECALCVSRDILRDPTCKQDCQNIWYVEHNSTSAPNKVDECGNCVPQSEDRAASCKQDCNGEWAGTAFIDECGQCVVNNSPVKVCKSDCAGTYYFADENPPHSIDDCGECNIPADMNKLKDNCGICTNREGYVTATDCTPDCKGVYRLTTSPDRAFTDSCGDCWLATEKDKTNLYKDSCGECHPAVWDGIKTNDTQGLTCKCGRLPDPCPGEVGVTTCNDNCPGTNLCPGTSQPYDSCGRCPSSPQYGKGKDDCGICCDESIGIKCNEDKDSCGECFGFDKKKNPCGICSNAPTVPPCLQDCDGVWGGTAAPGCDGLCNSGPCATCGDGIVQIGEACDLGSDDQGNPINSKDCVLCQEKGKSTSGALIGGIIGGVAAIAFLGLAAFFALKYAQKAGLIGSANKQVDMGASNSNPLYKSEVNVHSNPLYAN